MFGAARRNGISTHRLIRGAKIGITDGSIKLRNRNTTNNSHFLRFYSKRPLGVSVTQKGVDASFPVSDTRDNLPPFFHSVGRRGFIELRSARVPPVTNGSNEKVLETPFEDTVGNALNSFRSSDAMRFARSSVSLSSDSQSVFVDPMSKALGFRALSGQSHPALSQSQRSFSTEPPRGSQYKTSAKIPTPKSAPISSSPFGSIDIKALMQSGVEITWSFTKSFFIFLIKLPGNTLYYITHGKERREYIQSIKDLIKKEVDHYWTGTKLLMADVRTARELLGRTLSGSTLTRRERKQLLRTVSDLFRLVPFSMFILIPMAEFALPLALRLFPNMMPSTFQDSLKAEENMKRELQGRIAMAQFFQETLGELAKEQKRIAAKRITESPDNEIANIQEQTAASMLEFLERARQGEMMPPDVIVQYAKYFQDDLTLDNMPRMQLVNMCRYMQLQPYGSEAFLRFQLRHKIRTLKEDDQRIIWEGIESLTKMELREACQERGMRSTGLSKEAYKRSLQQWLDLSVHKNVPISLLIMSRTFFLQEEMTTSSLTDTAEKSVVGLADAISGLDKEVINEVILEVATSEEKKSNPDIRKIKLEVVTQQNEMIREEREAAEKKKKSAEKTEAPAQEESTIVEMEISKDQADELREVLEAKGEKLEDTVVTIKYNEEKVLDESETNESSPPDVKEADHEADHELSAAEMDAISQLLSADPVSKEREELARIKSAMQENKEESLEDEKAREESSAPESENEMSKESPDTAQLTDEAVAAKIEQVEKQAAAEADNSTTFTVEETKSEEQDSGNVPEAIAEDYQEEDPIVSRLKKRLESMVDKIEMQLSDVEVKIGDKLHMLDKDLDGVLSLEEMAECLHVVLKRKISMDEAMEIASTMDENADGVFTVQELVRWIETHKLVLLESEGRDADMDKIMESHTTEPTSKDDSSETSKSSKTKQTPEN